MKTKLLLLAWALLVVMVSGAHSTALRDNLRGLQGFWVLVHMDGPDLEKDGLVTRDLLQTRLEVNLRQAGIKIFSAPEMSMAPGQPILMLAVAARKMEGVKGYTVSILLGMIERVILDRDRNRIIDAMTWKDTSSGFIGLRSVRSIYDLVGDAADVFINDYLAANLK